jgi:hypothetical protein
VKRRSKAAPNQAAAWVAQKCGNSFFNKINHLRTNDSLVTAWAGLGRAAVPVVEFRGGHVRQGARG